MVQLVFFLLWLYISIDPSTLFHYRFVIICVLLRCFIDEVEDPTGPKTYFFILSYIRIKGGFSTCNRQ